MRLYRPRPCVGCTQDTLRDDIEAHFSAKMFAEHGRRLLPPKLECHTFFFAKTIAFVCLDHGSVDRVVALSVGSKSVCVFWETYIFNSIELNNPFRAQTTFPVLT